MAEDLVLTLMDGWSKLFPTRGLAGIPVKAEGQVQTGWQPTVWETEQRPLLQYSSGQDLF